MVKKLSIYSNNEFIHPFLKDVNKYSTFNYIELFTSCSNRSQYINISKWYWIIIYLMINYLSNTKFQLKLPYLREVDQAIMNKNLELEKGQESFNSW